MKTVMLLILALPMIIGLIVAFFFVRKHRDIVAFNKISIYLYFPVGIWSAVYFIICMIYAGIALSCVWIWPLIAIFCFVRIRMLISGDKKDRRARKVIRLVYRIVFVICLAFFLFIESRIVDAMTATPPADLDYIVVLGAGMRGTTPTNPLKVRIIRAAEYMDDNQDTLLIASGGQGPDEVISEAQCIHDQLVDIYGIDDERIILEERSRDTEQNLKNSLEIIGDPNASVGIVSNGFHEYRALMIAEHTGYNNVYSVPATTLLPVGIHYIVREFFGVVECMIKYR
ncbi:Uncharacterized SAM-binding protein YcdF, DUF218 family [Lachnospiraceae bacterium XBB2008]|nr:Uncharacterized SAM-binding protein YcdF, DUF218 family [Lachnospiraceae bacterium XBB2008]